MVPSHDPCPCRWGALCPSQSGLCPSQIDLYPSRSDPCQIGHAPSQSDPCPSSFPSLALPADRIIFCNTACDECCAGNAPLTAKQAVKTCQPSASLTTWLMLLVRKEKARVMPVNRRASNSSIGQMSPCCAAGYACDHQQKETQVIAIDCQRQDRHIYVLW